MGHFITYQKSKNPQECPIHAGIEVLMDVARVLGLQARSVLSLEASCFWHGAFALGDIFILCAMFIIS
jgi:hypothetical protein